MSNRFLLEAKNIIKTFPPTVALNDVHFCLRPGEIHGLMGENGSGKSTMCSIVSGIYPYDSGELFLDGEPYCPKNMTFVLAGIFIGITAILQISYANSITTVSSLRSISMIFQPLMGVLIAFAIQEWCNLTLGVFISQFTLSMMFNALIALGVPSKMQDVVLGVMLIIVMGIALNNKRISGFFERKARRKELMKRA